MRWLLSSHIEQHTAGLGRCDWLRLETPPLGGDDEFVVEVERTRVSDLVGERRGEFFGDDFLATENRISNGIEIRLYAMDIFIFKSFRIALLDKKDNMQTHHFT